MKLLVVSTDFPYPATNGHRLRNWAILESLAALGIETWLLALSPGDRPSAAALKRVREVCSGVTLFPFQLAQASGGRNYFQAVRALCSAMPYSVRRFRSGTLRDQVDSLCALQRFDAILCETCYPLESLPARRDIPIILDNHNLEHLLVRRYAAGEGNPLKRGYAALEWRKLRRWERAAWKRSSATLFCSERDRRQAPEADYAPTFVVPNVIELSHYRANPAGAGETLLYFGGMDWLPNRDAVQFFGAQVLPIIRGRFPRARFLVAGRAPAAEFQRRGSAWGVEFTGAVADMPSVIETADICVVPLRIGSGTRLKILEAAASAKAIVSTSVGAEGLDFTDRRDIRIADTPEAFADAVSELLADPAARTALGFAARARVESRYTMAAMQAALRAALRDVLITPLQIHSTKEVLWPSSIS